jgi:16S rRNA (uracil1498-N3)-methyltransferase
LESYNSTTRQRVYSSTFKPGNPTDPSHFLFFSSRIENGTVFLDKEECRHAFSALRTAQDQMLRVTNGKGHIFECRAERRTKDGAQLSVEKQLTIERTAPEVRVCVGLCDKEEFGSLVQDLAALGASAVVPLVCDRCQAPWWRAWEKHEARLRGKMVAGIKQARSAWLPLLAKPAAFTTVLSEGEGCPALVADETGAPLVSAIGAVQGASFVSCFVGPPGGFSQKEIAALASRRAMFVSLSQNRLRTELAAVLLCGFVRSTALPETRP